MSSNEIKLSDEQLKAIERLKEFVLEDTERCISLVGSAGTGNKYLEYCRLYEGSYKLSQTNIGEGCDANTEISTEIKESVPS